MRPGIYGAEVCQACGRLDTFSGFVHAMAVHVGRRQEFVCARCFSLAGPSRSASFMERREWAAAALARQPHRFCDLCQEPHEEAERQRLGEFWVCHRCAPGVSLEDLRDLRCCRYLDATYPGEEQLRAFELRLEAVRLDLEEIGASKEEQAVLRASRPRRAQAVLDNLGYAN